jgi:hypothetical protein
VSHNGKGQFPDPGIPRMAFANGELRHKGGVFTLDGITSTSSHQSEHHTGFAFTLQVGAFRGPETTLRFTVAVGRSGRHEGLAAGFTGSPETVSKMPYLGHFPYLGRGFHHLKAPRGYLDTFP